MPKKFSIIFIVVIGLMFLGWWVYSQLYSPLSSDEESGLFVVEKGEGLLDIAHNLKKEGLIKSKILFELYVFLQGEEQSLKAGEYSLSPSMSISELTQKIVQGRTDEIKITIIEGWNSKDIAQYLEEKKICQQEMFLEAVNRPEIFTQDFGFLNDKPDSINLEGYLFPDTYYIRQTEAVEDIVARMLDNFGQKLTPDLRKEIYKQEKTIFEIMIMASLLEKEVKTKEDKEVVSGILWKRLEHFIPLQVDATITYITGKKTTKISTEETQIDSPYNTYKYPGLPLGPICNPGLESILAAIYPQETDFWYYLSTPEGETIFSPTLEEHNIAKAEYLRE